MGEGECQLQPHPHAAGEPPDLLRRRDASVSQQRVEATLSPAAKRATPQPADVCSRHLRRKRTAVQDDPDASLDFHAGSVVVGPPKQLDVSGIREDQAENGLHRGALARAVFADKADHVTVWYAELHLLKGEVPIGLRESLYLEQIWHESLLTLRGRIYGQASLHIGFGKRVEHLVQIGHGDPCRTRIC